MNIKDIYLFNNLSSEEEKNLCDISFIKKFKTNERVFFEGEKSNYLHILLKGVVKVYKSDFNGNEILMHYFYPTNMIAELANLEDINFPATAIFESDGEMLFINYQEFKNQFLNNPKISFSFILSLTKKMKYLESLISNSLTMDSKAKVAKFIYENEELFLSSKQSKIANMLNIKPETLSRVLKTFKEKNIISKENSKFKILNKKLLKNHFIDLNEV